MPLKPCRECGRLTAESAVSCPNCGATDPTGAIGDAVDRASEGWLYRNGMYVALGAAVAFALLMFGAC